MTGMDALVLDGAILDASIGVVNQGVRSAAIAQRLGPQATVVTLLCDRAERYFSTPLFDGSSSVTP